jgi:hypothetical protein
MVVTPAGIVIEVIPVAANAWDRISVSEEPDSNVTLPRNSASSKALGPMMVTPAGITASPSQFNVLLIDVPATVKLPPPEQSVGAA